MLLDILHKNVHASIRDTTALFSSDYAALVALYITKAALKKELRTFRKAVTDIASGEANYAAKYSYLSTYSFTSISPC